MDVSGLYPGRYPFWAVLWLQNVVLIFVQFTTAASLYSQDSRYAAFLLRPLEWMSPWRGRGLLVRIHALGGLLVVGLNLVCLGTWSVRINSRGGSVLELLLGQPVSLMAWTNVLLTGLLLGMGAAGISLYANIRPDSLFSGWRFDYALSRQLHRLLFVGLVGVLGYHVFLFPRVSLVWMDWLSRGYAFGFLVLAIVFVLLMLVGMALWMVRDWLWGRMFARSDRTPHLSVTTGAVVLSLLGGGAVRAGLLSPAHGALLGGALVAGLVAWIAVGRIRERTPRSHPDG